jgi:cobalt/nickel transport system permease protein
MPPAFESLPCPESPVRRLDPRWKLAALLLAAAAVAALETPAAAGAAWVGALLLAALGRLPWRWYLARVGVVSLFLLLFTLPLPFLLEGPRLHLGGLQVSIHGLTVALLVCGKALVILTLMLVLLASAPLDDLLKAAHALHLPGLLIQLAVLTYRYIYVLSGELARLRVALRVRGYRAGVNRHSYRTIGHVAGTLLVRGYERAERVAQAMRCRGFTGRYYSLAEFHTHLRDIAAFLLIVGTAVVLLVWDVWQRSRVIGDW